MNIYDFIFKMKNGSQEQVYVTVDNLKVFINSMLQSNYQNIFESKDQVTSINIKEISSFKAHKIQ